MPHTYTATKPQKHLKQINLIFRLEAEGRPYHCIKPMPRNLPSVEKARLLLAMGAWDYEGIAIGVWEGTTASVRKTRKIAQWSHDFDGLISNILDHGSPYPEERK